MVRVLGDKALSGHDHCRQRTFHVSRTSAKEHAVADSRFERGINPAVSVARRHHVGVSGEGQRFALAAPCPEVLGVAKIHPLNGKTDRAQTFNH
ncbi:hypothetical protein D3C86_1624690 [compost metagenome]